MNCMKELSHYQYTQMAIGNDSEEWLNDLQMRLPFAEEVLAARFDLAVSILRGEV